MEKYFEFFILQLILCSIQDDKHLRYYLKWADAVLITYSITQQDSFEMALAYLDAITSYSKSLTVSTNELVLMLLGNKLDLERIRQIESNFSSRDSFLVSSVESFRNVKVKPLQRNIVVLFVKQLLLMIMNMFNNYFIELFEKFAKNANELSHRIPSMKSLSPFPTILLHLLHRHHRIPPFILLSLMKLKNFLPHRSHYHHQYRRISVKKQEN